jgi:metallo-beta-lactamase class B
MLTRFHLLFLLALATSPLVAQTNPSWTTNHDPFRIAGNLYYVGSNDLAAYLITTPKGHLLLNGNLPASVPQICQNIKMLGFKLVDVKLLLNSQAHFDHAGGLAELKHLTHARLAIMAADVAAIESGGRTDFLFYKDSTTFFPPVRVDRVLHDGERVHLGNSTLTAHLTPGHTPGDTTWTLDVPEAGHVYHVLIFGGASINAGTKLTNNVRYPQVVEDFERTFQQARMLPCDIFLGAHGGYFNLLAKYSRLQANKPNPFIDPTGYQAYIAEREQAFRTELAQQKGANSGE